MSGNDIDKFMSQMFTAQGDLLDASFEVDISHLAFIEPTGVASLANAIEYARARNCVVKFLVGDHPSEAVSYLDDAGFFELYDGSTRSRQAGLRRTTAPLHRVAHAQSYAWLEGNFADWLARQMSRKSEELGSLKTCVKEIFNNIEDHSGITIGCTHMQHFPGKKEVVIAVCDFGIGIPNAIRKKFPEKTDADAVKHATLDGVTSGTTSRNRGVGLDLLIQVVVERNGGVVRIHSGHGKLACRMSGQNQLRTPVVAPAFYPGTMIEIRLNTATFVPDEIGRENLEW